MRRILLLAYHFPPDPAVGSLRASNVASALVECGHEVTVVTAALSREQEAARPCLEGLRIRSVKPAPAPRDLYRRLRGGRGRSGEPDTQGVSGDREGAWVPPAAVSVWKRLFSSLMWLPDDHQGFITPAWRAGRRAHREGCDVLYTTAPPFSTNVAGWLISRTTGLPWICEYRDPWVSNPGKPEFVRSGLSDGIERVLERATVRRASRLVAASAGIRDDLSAQAGGAAAAKVLLVRNGIKELIPRTTRRVAGNPIRMLHTGTFYHGRDPRPILAGLRWFRDHVPSTGHDVVLELIGDCRWFNGQSVEAMAEDVGVASAVRFRDWIPHAEARTAVEQADLLLLLARRQPAQVPNKLYDYLGTRRPILAHVDAGGESAALLESVGGHFIVTSDDPAEIGATLHSAIKEVLDGSGAMPSDEEQLVSLTTAVQMAAICSDVESL